MTIDLGTPVQGDTVTFLWTTRDSTGAGIVRSVDGTVQCYEDGGLTQITAGITDTESFDSVTGLNKAAIVATAANGYDNESVYDVVLSGATIDGVSAAPEVLGRFKLGGGDVYSGRIAAVRQSSSVHVYLFAPTFNGEPIPATDLSNVQITVWEVVDSAGSVEGSVRINAQTMDQVASLDLWKYRATSSGTDEVTTVEAGLMYVVKCEFDHLDRTDRVAYYEAFYRDAA